MNPPDRGSDKNRKVEQPLNFVRGGGVCVPPGPNAKVAGHIIRGSNKAAVCLPTVGGDNRTRWRGAGDPPNAKSRHSTASLQRRQGAGSAIYNA